MWSHLVRQGSRDRKDLPACTVVVHAVAHTVVAQVGRSHLSNCCIAGVHVAAMEELAGYTHLKTVLVGGRIDWSIFLVVEVKEAVH